MDAPLIPKPQSSFNLALALTLLALHLSNQQTDLLSKTVQALPPMRAAVLVTVACEELVEQVVDVV